MARIHVRYLIELSGAAGQLPRYFWQPSTALRAAGWPAQRVPLDWASHADADQLRSAAIARAQELNQHLDDTRAAKALAATRPPPAPATRTLRDLVLHFQASKDWQGLAPTTQRGYRQCLVKIEEWAGEFPVRAIDAARVQKLKAALDHTPAYANAVVRVLRLLMEHARRAGWITANPAQRPRLAGTEPTGLIWPREAVALFAATADAMGLHSVGTAVILNEWLGQREADILRMPRAVLRAGNLVLRQRKTGAGVSLPVAMVPHLHTRLTEELGRRAADDAARTRNNLPIATTVIVSEATGLPYKADNFRHVFARVRARLAQAHLSFGIDHLMPGRDMADHDAFTVRTKDLTFMHLRHTAITRLAEAKCDANLIASISGHAQQTVAAIMDRYMVRTAEIARGAFQRRMDAEGIGAPEPEGETGT